MTTQPLPSSSRRYTTATTSTKGIVMNDRDWWALRIVAEQGAIRLDHLGQLFAFWFAAHKPETERKNATWSNEPRLQQMATRRITRRWEQAGLAYSRRIDAEPLWIAVSSHGMRELGLSYDTDFPEKHQRHHLVEVMRIRLLLMQRRPNDQWISERQIRANYDEKQRGQHQPHTPDALLVTMEHGNREHIAIEVELTRKSNSRLDHTLEELTASYDRVWYFIPQQVETSLLRAMNTLSPDDQKKIQAFRL